ncbi:MAG: hypothetical protein M0Z67_06615 [Nitrospiraceae bacterium]|nr:hypothetical protein [Nitrospiraceae bacterium]
MNLVVYGNGARPTTYELGTTAIQYAANGSRAQISSINAHCLGCHSDKNNTTTPFGDGKTPKQYAWDGNSVDARYSQTGTTPWGKYSSTTYPNVTPKDKRTKAYSAHGNAVRIVAGGAKTVGCRPREQRYRDRSGQHLSPVTRRNAARRRPVPH